MSWNKKTTNILLRLGLVIGVLIIAAALVVRIPTADATGETFAGSSTLTARVNADTHFTGLQISAAGNPDEAVTLTVNNGSLAFGTTTGITFTGNNFGSTVQMSGSLNDVNAALTSMTYTSTNVGSDTLTATLLGAGEVYYPGTQHLYEFVSVDGDIDWNDARIAAASRTKGGATGYLATITSQGENDFVSDRLLGAGWMGASDSATEGDWKWVVGPEAGTSFWSGEGNGSTVGGGYANWNDGEPNNASNEDCGQYLAGSGGQWNDLPCAGFSLPGYVVEYGAPGNLPNVPSKSVAITTTAATYPSGNGSLGTPYQITDCQRFQDMNQNLSAHYVLMQDIDCTETANWNGGRGFNPIGDNTASFTGTLDGAGHNVHDLIINRADDDPAENNGVDQYYVGVFGKITGADIHNFHVVASKIKGFEYVGGIVGYMESGTISNVSVNIGTADNSCNPGLCVWARYGHYGGGIVGYLVNGTIDHATTAAPVKGSGETIGGLVGYMQNGELSDSSSSSNIDGGQNIGGAVGYMGLGTLTRIHASGNIDTNTDEYFKYGIYGGGLIGYMSNGEVSESYATGDVHTDQAEVGGFVGSMRGGSIWDAYATGSVTSDSISAGGFVGAMYDGTINNTYASGSVSAAGRYGGGFMGLKYDSGPTGIVEDSFAVGEVTSNVVDAGFLGAITYVGGERLNRIFFDASTTGQTYCANDVNESSVQYDECHPINADGRHPKYFYNYSKAPFTTTGTRTWSEDIWYFDGSHLPVLRMGSNNTASQLPFDDDSDGISSTIENAAPHNGDGNLDGIADSDQAEVASYVNPITGQYVTLEVDPSCTITALSSQTTTSTDKGYVYPAGLMNYSLTCPSGFTTTVKAFYYNLDASGLSLRKYSPTPGTYSVISDATISSTGEATTVSYDVEDGGALDENGLVDGVIVDPAGLAKPAATVSAPNTGEQSIPVAYYLVELIVGLGIAGAALKRWRYLVNTRTYA